MKPLKRLFARVRNFASKRRGDERLREEMEEHLALQTEEMSRADTAACFFSSSSFSITFLCFRSAGKVSAADEWVSLAHLKSTKPNGFRAVLIQTESFHSKRFAEAASGVVTGTVAPLRRLCGRAGTAWWKDDLESSGVEK